MKSPTLEAQQKKAPTPLKQDEKKFIFSKKDILSGVAKWGIHQSPYDRPDNLEVVIDKLNEVIKPLFPKDVFGYLKMSYEEIIDFVFKYTTMIPEFVAWNNARKDGWNGAASRYSHPKPDYDFIDLHALARNVANDIIRIDHEVPIPLILHEGVKN